MARISIDNGQSFHDASEIVDEIDRLWSSIVSVMDDEIREDIHADFAPCSHEEFLSEYLKHAKDNIVIG